MSGTLAYFKDMARPTSEKIEWLRKNGFIYEKSLSGYFRLIDGRSGDIVYDDPGSEDMYDKDTAICIFYDFVKYPS